jgi:hypothetical protein
LGNRSTDAFGVGADTVVVVEAVDGVGLTEIHFADLALIIVVQCD